MKKDTQALRGENIGEVDYIKHKEYWHASKNKYDIMQGKKHLNVYDAGMNTLVNDKTIGSTDFRRICQLFTSINDDNEICTRKHGTIIPVSTKEDIMKIVGITSAKTWRDNFWPMIRKRRIVLTMIYDNMTNDDKSMRFIVNPLYTMRSRGISPQVYKLFYQELDKILPKAAIKDLRILSGMTAEAEDREKKRAEIYEARRNAPVYNGQQALELFAQHLMEDADNPRIYALNEAGRHGMHVTNPTLDKDLYFTSNTPAVYKGDTNPCNEDITQFRAWYLDFDAGRGEDGRYYNLDEVLEHKKMFVSIINALPAPTAVNETRNGFHVYWACENVTTEAEWKEAEDALLDAVQIADTACRNCARLMRVPSSMWCKDGYDQFRTRLLFYRDITYTADQLKKETFFHSFSAAACVTRYQERYPQTKKTAKKTPTVMQVKATSEEQQARLNAIRNLSLDTFDVPDQTTHVGNALDYIKCHANLAEFLLISSPISFCDIFHDDRHPSASIYDNGERPDRYYCSSTTSPVDDKGWTIVDCVVALAHCSVRQALRYLCQVYNVSAYKEMAA